MHQQYSSRFATPTSVPAPQHNYQPTSASYRTTTTTGVAVAPSSPEMGTSSSAAASQRSTPLIPASASHNHHHHHRQHNHYNSSSLGPSESNSPLSFHYPLDAPPTKLQHHQASFQASSTTSSRPWGGHGYHHATTNATLSRCSSVQGMAGGDSRMCSPVLLQLVSGAASPQHHHQHYNASSSRSKFPSPVPISACGSRLPRPPSGGGEYRGCGGGGWEGTRLRSPSSCSFSYQDDQSGQMEGGCSPPTFVAGSVEAISSTYDQFSPPRLLPRFTSGMGARVVVTDSPTAPTLHRSSAPRSVRRVLRVVSNSASKQPSRHEAMSPTHHDAPCYRSLGGNTPPPQSCASTPLVSPARSAIGCEEGYSVRRGIVGISLFRTATTTTTSHQDAINASSGNGLPLHMTSTPDKVMAIRHWDDTCHRPTPSSSHANNNDADFNMFGDGEDVVPCRPSKNRSMRQPLFDTAASLMSDTDEEVVVVQQPVCDHNVIDEDELFEGTISGGSGEDADVEVRNRRYVDLDVTFNEDDDTEVVGMTAEGEFLLRVCHKSTMPPAAPTTVARAASTSVLGEMDSSDDQQHLITASSSSASECRIVPIAHTTSASSSLLPKPTPRPTPTPSALLHAASTTGTLSTCPTSKSELVSSSSPNATTITSSSSCRLDDEHEVSPSTTMTTATTTLAPLATTSVEDGEDAMRTTTPLDLISTGDKSAPSSLSRPLVSTSRRAPRCYRVLKGSGGSSSTVDLSGVGGGDITPCAAAAAGKTYSGFATPSARAFAQPIFGTPTTAASTSCVVSPQPKKIAMPDDQEDVSLSPRAAQEDESAGNLSGTCQYTHHSPTAANNNHNIVSDECDDLPTTTTMAPSSLPIHLMRVVSDSPSLTSTLRPDPVQQHHHHHRAPSPITTTSFGPPPPLCTPPAMHPITTHPVNVVVDDQEESFSPLPATAATMTVGVADTSDSAAEEFMSEWERRKAMMLRAASSARSSSSPSLMLPTISHTPWSRSGSQLSSMTGMRRGRHQHNHPFGVDPRGITFHDGHGGEDDLAHHTLGRAHSAADSTHYEDMHLANHTLGAASHLYSHHQHHHPKASDRFGSVDAVDVALQKKSRDYFAELKRYRKLKRRLEDRENYPRPDRILQKLMLIEAKWQAQAHQKLVEDSTSMFSMSSLL